MFDAACAEHGVLGLRVGDRGGSDGASKLRLRGQPLSRPCHDYHAAAGTFCVSPRRLPWPATPMQLGLTPCRCCKLPCNAITCSHQPSHGMVDRTARLPRLQDLCRTKATSNGLRSPTPDEPLPSPPAHDGSGSSGVQPHDHRSSCFTQAHPSSRHAPKWCCQIPKQTPKKRSKDLPKTKRRPDHLCCHARPTHMGGGIGDHIFAASGWCPLALPGASPLRAVMRVRQSALSTAGASLQVLRRGGALARVLLRRQRRCRLGRGRGARAAHRSDRTRRRRCRDAEPL